jgi:thioredoxin-like negative regulator of GroEL
MDELCEKEIIEKAIKDSEMVLLYFGSKSCNVCNVLKPRIEELLKEYPKINSYQVDVEKSMEASAVYNIFTIPAILVFVEGKETIREARYISIQDLDSKVERYYNLLF